MDFYREATKTVVSVNPASLVRIRQEALVTQEALIVDEQDEQKEATDTGQVRVPLAGQNNTAATKHSVTKHADREPSGTTPTQSSDGWENLKAALCDYELQALVIILNDDNSMHHSLKEYADSKSIMLEVLVDGINEKAMDYIGDNILDDDFRIYEDYEEQVKGMIAQI